MVYHVYLARAHLHACASVQASRSLACLCKRHAHRRAVRETLVGVSRETPQADAACFTRRGATRFLRSFYGSCTLRHAPVMSSTFLPFSNVKHFRAGTQLASLAGHGSPVLERGSLRPSPHPRAVRSGVLRAYACRCPRQHPQRSILARSPGHLPNHSPPHGPFSPAGSLTRFHTAEPSHRPRFYRGM